MVPPPISIGPSTQDDRQLTTPPAPIRIGSPPTPSHALPKACLRSDAGVRGGGPTLELSPNFAEQRPEPASSLASLAAPIAQRPLRVVPRRRRPSPTTTSPRSKPHCWRRRLSRRPWSASPSKAIARLAQNPAPALPVGQLLDGSTMPLLSKMYASGNAPGPGGVNVQQTASVGAAGAHPDALADDGRGVQ